MADQDSGYKWWIRYVLVPVIIGGTSIVALIAEYINRPSSPAQGIEKPPVIAPPPPQHPPLDSAAEVEALVARWLAAFLGGNVDEFVALSSEPFYFDQEIVLTKPDLRAKYVASIKKRDKPPKFMIRSFKMQPIRELQSSGYDLSKDRIVANMNLSLDDFVVDVVIGVEADGRTRGPHGIRIVVRRNSGKVAGIWD